MINLVHLTSYDLTSYIIVGIITVSIIMPLTMLVINHVRSKKHLD
jgi:hypothetical protein